MRARRHRGHIWLVLGALAAAALVGCSGDDDDVTTGPSPAPTPEFLSQAASRSRAESHRFEIAVDFTGIPQVGALESTFRGEVSGTRTHLDVDLNAMFEALRSQATGSVPAQLEDVDFSIEQITDGSVLYLRAPMFAALSGMMPGRLGPLEDIARIGDGWGRIELDQLGDAVPADVLKALGANQGASPAAFLDALGRVADVRSIGRSEVRGEEVDGYTAEVNLGSLLEAQGIDADTFESMVGSPSVRPSDLTVPLQVWVDGDRLVRRVVMDLTADTFASAGAGDVPQGFAMEFTVDFFDYGDDIDIELPERSSDITSSFRQLLQLSGN